MGGGDKAKRGVWTHLRTTTTGDSELVSSPSPFDISESGCDDKGEIREIDEDPARWWSAKAVARRMSE